MDFPNFYVKGPTPCSQGDPDDFFPEADEPESLRRAKEAKKLCNTCPYQVECLRWAIETRELGVWGGTSEYERKQIIARMNSKRNPYISRSRV